MKYKVTYRKRFDAVGEEADSPDKLVDPGDGVVLDAEVVEQITPPSYHVEENSETSGEDDGWMTFGTETWIYDVADDRDSEFRHALVTSGVVLSFERIEEDQPTPV